MTWWPLSSVIFDSSISWYIEVYLVYIEITRGPVYFYISGSQSVGRFFPPGNIWQCQESISTIMTRVRVYATGI